MSLAQAMGSDNDDIEYEGNIEALGDQLGEELYKLSKNLTTGQFEKGWLQVWDGTLQRIAITADKALGERKYFKSWAQAHKSGGQKSTSAEQADAERAATQKRSAAEKEKKRLNPCHGLSGPEYEECLEDQEHLQRGGYGEGIERAKLEKIILEELEEILK